MDGWRQHERHIDGDNDALILAATAGAVNIRLGQASANLTRDDASASAESATASAHTTGQISELAHLAVIVGLVWRTVVMWILLLALLTLARLLG
jgi:adenosylcobinamide-phosphate synthase